MRCAVTGGAGFIGSNLVSRLLSEGHTVTVVDNFDPYYDPGIKKQNIQPFLNNKSFSLLKADILDKDKLVAAFKDVECVFHLAAQAGVSLSLTDPLKYSRVNVDGTLNVLEACRASSVKKIVFSSSSSVYGKAEPMPFKEDILKLPVSPYGVTKLACEHLMRIYHEIYGLPSVCLRYFTVYGPRMRPDLAISIFVSNALSNKPLTIFGKGDRTRDFTYVDDVVEANLLSEKKGRGDYNIAGGERMTVLNLAKTILAITNSSSKIEFKEEKKGDAEHTWGDTSKAGKELGWKPRVGMTEGIRRYVDWVQARRGG